MEEMILSFKHYWRFVDSEVLQQFPLRLRKSYGTMGANSSLSVSTIRLCLLM